MKKDSSYLIGNQFAKGNQPNQTSFTKGHKPWNKGKKGIHLSSRTEFKKGHKPNNKVSIGSKKITTNTRDKKKRYRIKTGEPSVWMEYAKFVWIQHNGLIPKGYLIHHIDENTLNDKINNLALVTRKAHFEIHKIGEKGRAALQRKISVKKGGDANDG